MPGRGLATRRKDVTDASLLCFEFAALKLANVNRDDVKMIATFPVKFINH